MDWLAQCFQDLIETLESWWLAIVAFFRSIYDAVASFFDYLFDKIELFFVYVYDLLVYIPDYVYEQLSSFVDLIPDISSYWHSPVLAESLGFLAVWFDLSLLCTLLQAYVSIGCCFLAFKYFLKLIPTVG